MKLVGNDDKSVMIMSPKSQNSQLDDNGDEMNQSPDFR